MSKWTLKEVRAMANRLLNTRPDASSAEVMRNAASMLADISMSIASDEAAVPVGEVFGPKAVSTMVALDKPLPSGTKLYTHPPAQPPIDLAAIREVADWVEAKREHSRLVAVYNERVEYARQHGFGVVDVDHEFQAMHNQQRAMNALIQPMFEALDKLSRAIGDTP